MSTELKSKLITLLEEQFATGEDRVAFDYLVQLKTAEAGYLLQRNYSVKQSNGKRGFIDYLITATDGQQCVIEVDRKAPRIRSLGKLNALPVGVSGFVLLRDGKHPRRYIADGVDVVRATRYRPE